MLKNTFHGDCLVGRVFGVGSFTEYSADLIGSVARCSWINSPHSSNAVHLQRSRSHHRVTDRVLQITYELPRKNMYDSRHFLQADFFLALTLCLCWSDQEEKEVSFGFRAAAKSSMCRCSQPQSIGEPWRVSVMQAHMDCA